MDIFHKDLVECPVKELPIKLVRLYEQECIRLELSEREMSTVLNDSCRSGFAWSKSVKGNIFWNNVANGIWDEEYDELTKEEYKDLKSEVINTINKIKKSTQTKY